MSSNPAIALALLGGGTLVAWAGLADPPGGLSGAIGRVFAGQPAGGTNLATATPTVTVDDTATTPAANPGGATAQGGRAQIIATAQTWLGVPYRWGGTSRKGGVDCSGLVQNVYAANGIHLPRVTQTQQLVGRRVAADAAQPADLVFFGHPASHVGIYLGNGQLLHAPHTGAFVRVESVASVAKSLPGEAVTYRDVMGDSPAPATPRHSGQVRTP